MKDIRDALINTDLKITDIANDAKVSRQSIYLIMSGKSSPKLSTIKSLCDAMGLDFKEYLPKNIQL